jgi:uncharacterized protein (DUF488 family)
VKIFTIGFTKTSAENFFRRISNNNVKKILDVRLNNVSQLAGFAKRDDLKYFAKEISGASYQHLISLAPQQGMLDAYKKEKGEWNKYEQEFMVLMRKRRIENLDKSIFDGACLLCSEDTPHYCHRRLVAEYLKDAWGNVEVVHL